MTMTFYASKIFFFSEVSKRRYFHDRLNANDIADMC